MKEQKSDKQTAQRRRNITIVTAVIAAIISGIIFNMMLSKIPNMRALFFLMLGFFALVLTYLIIWTLSAYKEKARLAKILRRSYLVFLAAGLAFFLALQGLIISGSHTEEAEADCLIILGAGLRNGAPSLILRRRLNAAVEYLKERGDVPVIVSGGLGRGETITEAEAMSRYLSSRGVDASLIWKEEASTSTRENLTFSLALMEEKGLDAENTKVAVVTNEFHLYRAKHIAGKVGLDATGIAAETPGLGSRIIYSCREAFALASELIFG